MSSRLEYPDISQQDPIDNDFDGIISSDTAPSSIEYVGDSSQDDQVSDSVLSSPRTHSISSSVSQYRESSSYSQPDFDDPKYGFPMGGLQVATLTKTESPDEDIEKVKRHFLDRFAEFAAQGTDRGRIICVAMKEMGNSIELWVVRNEECRRISQSQAWFASFAEHLNKVHSINRRGNSQSQLTSDTTLTVEAQKKARMFVWRRMISHSLIWLKEDVLKLRKACVQVFDISKDHILLSETVLSALQALHDLCESESHTRLEDSSRSQHSEAHLAFYDRIIMLSQVALELDLAETYIEKPTASKNLNELCKRVFFLGWLPYAYDTFIKATDWLPSISIRCIDKPHPRSRRYHAEVQMVYTIVGENPDNRICSFNKYLGCSKYSCKSCWEFLKKLTCYVTGGCHGKVYPRWKIPNETDGMSQRGRGTLRRAVASTKRKIRGTQIPRVRGCGLAWQREYTLDIRFPDVRRRQNGIQTSS